MTTPSLSDVGYAGLFLWIFAEQAGLPIPALPILLAAGTLVAGGKLGLLSCIGLVLAACLAADVLWYYIGRAKGVHILHFICRLSWKPNTCIGTTKGVFMRYGAQTLLFAKFVPGLNTLAPPLTGAAGISLRRFLAYDTVGALIWGLVPLLAGMGLRRLVPAPGALWTELRPMLPGIAIGLLAAFLLGRYIWRRIYVLQLERELEKGITVDEFKEMVDRGDDLVLLDIRHILNLRAYPLLLPGAKHIAYNEVETRIDEIPLEKSIIVYCNCPQDQASALVARQLHRLGASSARVLKGGLDAWTERGFATIPYVAAG